MRRAPKPRLWRPAMKLMSEKSPPGDFQWTSGLLRRRHREFGALGRGFRPALHDGLLTRIEAHPFLAVGMGVAEQASLPAAKAMPGHGHGDRHVDAHHADLDA